MKNWKLVLAGITATAVMASCNNTANKQRDAADTTAVSDTAQITVNPLSHAKDFPGAKLTINSLTAEKVGADSARITVKYGVENFTLTEQTEHDHHLANSHEGQHIHFILNNKPYDALYKPEHSVVVEADKEYTLLSFLSRSFHESLKTQDAYKLVKFKVNKEGAIEELPVPTEPSLFYSRPKGEYKGHDTEHLLLDFFVINTTISADEHHVKAEINGEEFKLDQWVPYEILNLPLGENTVELTLVDKDGKKVSGDHTSVERKITLKAE